MNDTTKSEDKPVDDGDWLGYSVYADTLWARIETAIKKDDVGDDPLVIGLFGEWGAGKSHLLKLIQNRAEAGLTVEQERRKELDAGFSLTIPVFFQPWKYEHEEFLHVPMLMHILDAYVKAWEKAQTGSESKITELKKWAEKAKPLLGWGWRRVLRPAAESFAGQFSLKLKLAPEIEELAKDLSNFVQILQDEKDREAVPLKATRDGHYYYRWHETMRQLTRPALYPELLKDEKGKQLDVSNNPKINFVVFIDDLDRCLPEKAVQTLELIKTMFNVESFAFVLALDDEVIERGIGHRYQAYNFAGKKPEMPITGFEYLEKIVHLPFKLPALTRAQAQNFIEHLEEKIAPEGDKWFRQVLHLKPNHSSREFSTSDEADLKAIGWDINNSKRIELAAIEDVFDLSDLVLKAFDAYVPRKLTRMVELWYNTIEIAKARHKIEDKKALIELKPDAQVDARIAFTLLMVQLFHPDLYRVFRRHEQTFRAFYESFLPNGLSPSISDIDLWRWAAFTRHPDARSVVDAPVGAKLKDEEQPIDLKTTLQSIAKLADGYRFDAQQRRLPLVERIIEHRAAQRHVFDALKLFEALKAQMPALPNGFKVAQYFSLLSEFDETLTPTKTTEIKVDLTKRFTTDANQLYDRLVSVVESTQAEIPTLDGFDSGHSVDTAVLDSVYQRVVEWLEESSDTVAKANRKKNLLRGLSYLARYIAPQERDAWWALVKEDSYEKALGLKLRSLYHDVRAALHQDNRFDAQNLYLPRQKWNDHSDDQEPIPGFVKVLTKDKKFQPFNKQPEVELEPFYMARYLTTVGQFEKFMKEGYGKIDFWSEEVLAWKKSEKLSKFPNQWSEQQLFTNRPVMSMSWYDAQAYIKWLNEQPQFIASLKRAGLSKYKAALPTEWQWERAARAKDFADYDDRDFPWGGGDAKTAHLKANIDGSKIGSPSVVGMFEPNPLGIFDLSGNVWEWQSNLYPAINNHMTMRGGSWDDPPDFARCSCRNALPPYGWNECNGFRLVLSLADL